MSETQPVTCDGRIVCASLGKEYSVRDVIDAAIFRDELVSIWKEFLCHINAEERAKELDLELDDDAVDEMAELFRYEHDLITAEETERWLEHRGVTLEDFTDYIARKYWKGAIEDLSPEDVDLVSASPNQRELLTIELIFSDEVDRLTKQLMWRLAAVAASGEIEEKAISTERENFLDRIKPLKLKAWLNSLGRDEDWLTQISAMEAAYRRVCEAVLNPQTRRKQLALLRMGLTLFEAEAIQLESLDAAKEALLCIRQDGMSMEEVATEARYPYRRITFRHEDVPPDLQQKFWSVAAGDLLEPIAHGEGFELFRITKKSEPDLDDTIVQARIDERLLEQHFSHLVHDHVESRLPEALSAQ